ncbi:MAG: M48 family metallopeptidase [Acidobacteriota bacterium]|nr:M48 family metallopeptidase [Acidobacteriota bacterium]
MDCRRFLIAALCATMALCLLSGRLGAQETPRSGAGDQAAHVTQNPEPGKTGPVTPSDAVVTAYKLPPQLYSKARNLSRIFFAFDLASGLYALVILWLILHFNVAPKYRRWAEGVSAKYLVQAVVFAPLLLLSIDILELPLSIFEQRELRRYGLSIQGWTSWARDWGVQEILTLIVGTILVAIVFAIIRRSPRRWWLYFWLAVLPIATFLIFLQPIVVDPLFHQFGPLQQKDPALTAELERMAQCAGVDIPPSRMYWMGASEKSTQLNAYVTGLGSSKRIVVWDTTIAKMTTPQIVFVVGHEMGHYVLHHVPEGAAILAGGLLIVLFLVYCCAEWMLRRWGEDLRIRGAGDWASLPALLLLAGIFSFIGNPIANAVSRHFEHQADQYGLEVTHGLTPNSGQVAAQSFETDGIVDLADPRPSRMQIILTYTHPSIAERIRFSLGYDPWAHGGHGKFVH